MLLNFMFQVVQEYERAVIFRLGRLLSGGSRGPGKMSLEYLEWYQFIEISFWVVTISAYLQKY